MGQAIEVEDLTKVYPDGATALGGISFGVREGEIFGLLGPNGAGKTTAIRILVTLLPKTAGRVQVAGADLDRDPEAIRRAIGYAAQFIGVDDDLTARENLILQGRLHGLATREARRRSDALLESFALTTLADRRVSTFSGGMRRRLDLAQALVHRPRLLILDEPTTGLDPQTRRALWSRLETLNREGTTVLLTTHYLEEADALCQRLAIVDRGRIVVTGAPRTLKEEIGSGVITVTVADSAGMPDVGRAAALLSGLPGAGEPAVFDHSVTVPIPDAGRSLSDVVRRLDEAGIPIATLAMASPSLDEVFLRYTGERMPQAEAPTGRLAVSSMFSNLARRRRP